MLGDIGSAVGVPLGDIAEIYGKARVQGRLFAEDINQLTGRGIPIIQALAKQFGVADSGVRKLVEDGKIGFPQLLAAFQAMTGAGGQFAGGMAKQSQTLLGQWSTLKDNIALAVLPIGQQLLPVVTQVVQRVGQLVQWGSGILGPWAQFAPLVAGAAVAVGALGAALTAVGMASIGLGALAGLMATLVAKLGTVGIVAAAGATALGALRQVFGGLIADGEQIATVMEGRFTSISENWQSLTNNLREGWKLFVGAVKAGDMEAAAGVAFSGVNLAWQQTMLQFKQQWADMVADLVYQFDLGIHTIPEAWDQMIIQLSTAFGVFQDSLLGPLNELAGLLGAPAERVAANRGEGERAANNRNRFYQQRSDARAAILAEENQQRRKVDRLGIKEAEQQVNEAKKRFAEAAESAAQAAMLFRYKQQQHTPEQQQATPAAQAAQKTVAGLLGQFNSTLAGQQLAQKAQDRTAKATELTARNTARMLDAMQAGGGGILVG
jgi:tape measure domain-containing protein